MSGAPRRDCYTIERLAALREGELSRNESAAAERHVEGCVDCGARLAELDGMLRAVASDIDVPEVDLVDAVRLRAQLPPRRGLGARTLGWRALAVGATGAGSLLAAAAAFALVVGRPTAPSVPAHEAFQARGAATESEPDAWVRLRLYRAHDRGAATPLVDGDSITPDDRLLVAYDNLGPSPYAYLTVIAVDAGGRVHWYYPPAESTGARSIPARAGRGVELTDEITQPLAPGRARVFALFSRQPLEAAAIDRAIGGASVGAIAAARTERGAPRRLALDAVGQHSIELRVDAAR